MILIPTEDVDLVTRSIRDCLRKGKIVGKLFQCDRCGDLVHVDSETPLGCRQCGGVYQLIWDSEKASMASGGEAMPRLSKRKAYRCDRCNDVLITSHEQPTYCFYCGGSYKDWDWTEVDYSSEVYRLDGVDEPKTFQADGSSGSIELEQAWVNHAMKIIQKIREDDDFWIKWFNEVFKIFKTRQHDYGSANIGMTLQQGVFVRELDKMARCKNHVEGTEMEGEPAIDIWYDIAGYGVIGAICEAGEWPVFGLEMLMLSFCESEASEEA